MNYGEFNSGNSTGLDIIVGNTATSYNTNLLIDIDIAVYNDVRTMGYCRHHQGDRFDLAGNPLSGGPYTNNVANSQLHDGTSDGNYNYSVDFVTGDLLAVRSQLGQPDGAVQPHRHLARRRLHHDGPDRRQLLDLAMGRTRRR